MLAKAVSIVQFFRGTRRPKTMAEVLAEYGRVLVDTASYDLDFKSIFLRSKGITWPEFQAARYVRLQHAWAVSERIIRAQDQFGREHRGEILEEGSEQYLPVWQVLSRWKEEEATDARKAA